jgi:hypothetical protein
VDRAPGTRIHARALYPSDVTSFLTMATTPLPVKHPASSGRAAGSLATPVHFVGLRAMRGDAGAGSTVPFFARRRWPAKTNPRRRASIAMAFLERLGSAWTRPAAPSRAYRVRTMRVSSLDQGVCAFRTGRVALSVTARRTIAASVRWSRLLHVAGMSRGHHRRTMSSSWRV